MYRKIKKIILDVSKRILLQDEIRFALSEASRNHFAPRSILLEQMLYSADSPYDDLGLRQTLTSENRTKGNEALFISGRFRSGSTLLWNIFRTVPNITAYYEPFNESTRDIRFMPLDEKKIAKIQKMRHKNVDQYDKEYQGLNRLKELYREEWIRDDLLMDKSYYAPDMKKFINFLIENAKGRAVLQFNRIDFRLPWIRRNFPSSGLIHIYRHPRDQWCSTLLGRINDFSKNMTMDDFSKIDGFYLKMWSRDLRFHFPFLDENAISHPYEMFYYIWKLSFIFGKRYADYSICFEDLVMYPEMILKDLFEKFEIKNGDIDLAKSLIVKPEIGKWKNYESEMWFKGIESRCEDVLQEFMKI